MDDHDDDSLNFDFPIWFLSSSGMDDQTLVFVIRDLNEVPASALFTDEDLALRYLGLSPNLIKNFRPKQLLNAEHVHFFMDFLESRGILNVTIDPKKRIAQFRTIKELRKRIERAES